MGNKNVNVRKGKKGFQKTTPKAAAPSSPSSKKMFGLFKTTSKTPIYEPEAETLGYGSETLSAMNDYLDALPAPPMPEPHPAESEIIKLGMKVAGDSRDWKANQVFNGLVREGSLRNVQPPHSSRNRRVYRNFRCQ